MISHEDSRTEVHDWLHHAGAAIHDLPASEPLVARVYHARANQHRLSQAGLAGISWPVEHGGPHPPVRGNLGFRAACLWPARRC